MPRRGQLYGRPGTQVIPAGWAVGQRPVAQGTMTAAIALRVPGGTKGPFNPTTGTYPVVPHPVYATARCRVQALTNVPRQVDAAEDEVTVSAYLVTVPAGTLGLQVGHVGVVTGSGDALLDGRELKVDDIIRGTLLVERDLLCSLNT